ncbi:hypothetical protein PTI45_01989 [Paenibacillus nuruki]|uniref:Flagellar hook-length control protein-like C-terminal domain-containing protein n=1 Tax=Paenibacillus nuruki TaxID=1886670 RepID=A0A1E3L4U4_9BACL|nr:hypothetical protein [Paenibacillus nuruki]ODP28694.1 hypothetical protein PTI45_01989 [Paenibacillus nuruki]
MNIGSLFRGLIGDSKPGEARQMELKEGQVVRGVVTSVSEDGQEAVVQIQGVKVRAKLETPLQQGATTLLQVQAPDSDGLPVLKPVTGNPSNPLSNASMGEVLESFNLPDTKENREMITQMRASGITLNADNVKNIQSTLSQKPAGVPVGEWVQSAAVAIQRGLPVTAQSVSGLQQAIFGPPLHDLLSNLDNLVRATVTQVQENASNLGKGTTSDQAPENVASNPSTPNQAVQGNANPAQNNNPTSVLLGKLQTVLDQLGSIVAQSANPDTDVNSGKMTLPSVPNPNGPQSPTAPVTTTANNPTQQAQGTTTNASTTISPSNTAEDAPSVLANSTNTAATGSPKAQATEPWLGRVLKLLGAEHEQQVARASVNNTAPEAVATRSEQTTISLGANGLAQASTDPATARNANPALQSNMNMVNGMPNPTLEELLPAPTARVANPNGFQQIATNPDQIAPDAELQNTMNPKQVTANAQAQAAINAQNTLTEADPLLNPALLNNRNSVDATNPAHIAQQMASNTDDAVSKVQDTLKGILLQLTAADDVPPALKEAAQQLVQQLTGQQLLLNTDRTAPFAQVTMFVPFKGPDGQETASVQIQSRRGPKGELDASNCRLWFDLDMHSLGPTLVDVHVVDKIVTLKVHNDLEQLAPLVESKREEMATAMSALGYQLLSLKVDAMPVRSSATNENSTGMSDHDLLQRYAPPDYKGVDMKI